MTITLGRISLLYSKSTTKVTKQLPHILYHTCFFFFFHEWAKNMRTLQHGNWYQGARWVTVSRRKNKNREDLGGCGLGFRTSYTQNIFFLISNLH